MVIDEIQRVPDLLYTVHQFIEDTDLVFFMTGSSARKLKKSGVNLLEARALDKKLHLLCYPEVKDRNDYNLEHIFKAGMLPEMYLNPMEAEDLLETYKGNYLEMEIQLENEVNNLPSFINFLEKAAIWKNKKRKETSFPRFYFFDAGVARSIAHMSLPTETMTEFGVLFETYIMMEITTYIDYSGLSRTELTYYRLGSGKREVDFIIGDDVAIEVKSAKTIQDKHLVSLRELKEEGIFSSYIVVSREEIPRMLSDGILVLPWKEFLMKLWNGEIYGSKS